ncbi:MAG: class II aldolase/adducin family protein, partial [Solimonas sp.]
MNRPAALHVEQETEVLALKRRLAKVHRIITAGGLWPLTKGHVSCRIGGTERVLILGHIHAEGRNLADTDVEDIVTIDIEGNPVEGRIEPVDERFAHTEVYKARPDVQAVAHAHAPMAT